MNRLPVFSLLVAVCVVSCGKESVTNSDHDVTPPATITDLTVQRTGDQFLLFWTAPGDDGPKGRASCYDIRYAVANLGVDWGAAHVVPSPPTPGEAGQPDSATVSGIGRGPWQFGVKAADEAENWSILSNVVLTAPGDTIAPSAVTDLVVDLLTPDSAILRWTAPGDDGASGNASEYDLRYSATPITADTWADATRVTDLAAPLPGGEVERFTVGDLQKRTSYIFALRVADEDGNWSGSSNLLPVWIYLPEQLSFAPSRLGAFEPDWSPDGQQIAYATEAGELRYLQLHVVAASGGAPRTYTNAPLGARYPAWSPDGSRFAFGSSVSQGEASPLIEELSLMDAQPLAPAQMLKSHFPMGVRQPTWSPDGASIAYYVSGASGEIYIIPSSGGEARRLTGGWYIAGIDWSPDGATIVYSSKQTGNYDIWTIPSSGGEATQLTTDPGTEWLPRWSPDGTQVAYLAGEAIWIMNASDRTTTKVIYGSNAVPRSSFAWSPNGRSIAFTAGPADGWWNIWVQRVR